MSKIKIFLTEVSSEGKRIKQQKNEVDDVEGLVSSVSMRLDYRILSRNGVKAKFNTIERSLHAVSDDLKDISKFITKAVDEYQDAEDKIAQRAYVVDKNKITKFMSELFGNDYYDILSFAGTSIVSLIKNYNSTIFEKNKLKFKVTRDKTGRIVIRGLNMDFDLHGNSHSLDRVKRLLATNLGTNQNDYKKRLMIRLISEAGIPLYTSKNVRSILGMNFGKLDRSGIKDNLKLFTHGTTDFFEGFPALSKNGITFKSVGKSILRNTKDAFSSIGSDFNFKGALTTGEKISKGAGIFGTAVSAFSNLKIFTDKEYEDKSFVSKGTRFLTHTAIDVGSGAAAVAIGGTVGSLFVPPVGTAIGAAVGLGVGAAMNWKVLRNDEGKKISVVDYGKEKADDLIDSIEKSKVVKGIKDIKNTFGKKFSKLVW